MSDRNTIVRERQLAIRREIDRRGISLTVVAMDSGIPYPTIVSYFPGERDKIPATMPSAALFALIDGEALPLDLLSLMLPDGFAIVRAPSDIDHDALCSLAADYVAEKNRAHHPASESGRDLGPGERASLNRMAMQLVGGLAA